MRSVLLSPRWLVRHVLAVALIYTFLRLGWWQWSRAESGNVLSYGYTFEWPLFALFVAFMWWKMLRFELHPPAPDEVGARKERRIQARAQKEARRRRPARVPRTPAPARPATVADEEPDEELADYNRYLASLYQKDEPERD